MVSSMVSTNQTRFDEKPLVAMPMNSPGMYRGVIREDGMPLTAIFADEEIA